MPLLSPFLIFVTIILQMFSYMSRGFATTASPQTTQPQPNQVSNALGKAANAAREGSKIADAVENLKETFKK